MATVVTTAGWAFVFALAREAAPFRRHRPRSDVFVGGVGPSRSSSFVQRLIRDVRPAGVVIAGYAGALRSGLEVGDVVVAREIVDHRGDQDDRLAVPEVFGLGRHSRRGVVVTVDRVVTDPAAKRTLRTDLGADVVDTESAAVAKACQAAGVPFACVRVVSDTVDRAVPPQVGAVIAGGTISLSRAVTSLVRNPLLAWDFGRLARDSRRAAVRLADALGVLSSD
jgi:nucleoside phosphorylase